jgi:hypothetical protein
MEFWLTALERSDPALALRFSRFGYAAVNAGHILGIALLVGAIIPLNLRLMGCWPGLPRESLTRVLTPFAAGGLVIALVTGFCLFSARAADYADLAVFRVKIVLILIGTLSALSLHLRHGLFLETASQTRLRVAALISLLCWPSALLAGRLIAFMGD